jgi:hypothetical protein
MSDVPSYVSWSLYLGDGKRAMGHSPDVLTAREDILSAAVEVLGYRPTLLEIWASEHAVSAVESLS